MTYVFLIFVMTSNTANQQVIPMQSMDQCNAALLAMDEVKKKRTGWRDYNPAVNNAHCIEVAK